MLAGIKFNSDLLLSDEDREAFRALHPKLAFAFDDVELRALFEPLDRKANAEKASSRRLGLLSVALVTVALLAASAEMLLHGGPPQASSAHVVEAAAAHGASEGEARHAPEIWQTLFAAAAALAGLAGAAVGFFGVMFGSAKQHWLERRYLTERLRQLHFQTLIAWAPLIVDAAATGDEKRFQEARAARTARFKLEHVDAVGAKLAAIVGGRSSEDEAWLVKPMGEASSLAGPLADELFEALEQLRLGVQARFTDFKLREDHRLFSSSPRTQAKRFSTIALWCVSGLLLLHLAALVAAIILGLGADSAELAAISNPYIHVGAIWLAIVALAARTLEEGFQSHREEERYMHYSGAIGVVRRRFRDAHDPQEKLNALGELEDIAYEEMLTFLRANHDARFVM